MKPSFALSLSLDGIRLLHRAAGGWRVVGDVALDAQDMPGEFAMLRKTATSLEPGGLRTKVLLPNEQIKYLTIDTPDMDDAARRAAAVIALDGATPYAVDDLAFDISVDGNQTHVAAVAHETLAEAEAFANDHRFHPVSFVAIPGDQTYLGEPFFGVTKSAATLLSDGEEVEPDGIAVVVIGDIATPDGPVADETPVHQESTLHADGTPAAAEVETSQTAEADPPPEKAPEIEEASPPLTATTAAAASDAEPAKPAAEQPSAAPVPDDTKDAEGPKPALGFASRRGGEKAATPKLDGVTRAAPPEPATPVQPPTETATTAPKIDVAADTILPVPHVAPAEPSAPKTGFLSRRKAKAASSPMAAAPTASVPPASSEEDRLTVFGARKSNVGGKPRFLGLILTAALLVFLAGVAAWASVFLDDGIALSRIFGDREPKTAQVAPPAPEAVEDEQVEVASLDPALTEEDAAVLDALRDVAAPQPPAVLSDTEVEAKYAATGIWTRSPVMPPEPAGLVNIEDLYLTSIDPVSTATDAVALPAMASFATDARIAALSSPAAAGTQYAFNDDGLVIPTAQGALSPDGFTVILGRPPLVPPLIPARLETAPEDTAIRSALAALRPAPRPSGLVEKTERAQLGGLTRNELAGLRPKLRPQSLQQQAEAASVPPEPAPAQITTDGAVALALANTQPAIDNATQQAVKASIRPDLRPRNFARIVKRAQRRAEKEEVRVASAASVAPRVVVPRSPSKTSVAKQATVKNALNLRKVNLIGVYGKPSSRRALVRLGNGRYQKVVVGDRIDGGRVSAIGEGELRYTRRGRDLVLKMPR